VATFEATQRIIAGARVLVTGRRAAQGSLRILAGARTSATIEALAAFVSTAGERAEGLGALGGEANLTATGAEKADGRGAAFQYNVPAAVSTNLLSVWMYGSNPERNMPGRGGAAAKGHGEMT
jgi:hypothetical protein